MLQFCLTLVTANNQIKIEKIVYSGSINPCIFQLDALKTVSLILAHMDSAVSESLKNLTKNIPREMTLEATQLL